MAAASSASKLLSIGKNRSLQSLIHRNLLRGPTVSTTTAPISQTLNSTIDCQIPVLFNRELTDLKMNAYTAAEILKMMNPDLSVSYGTMGLPGIILKNNNNRKNPVSEEDDDDGSGDDEDFNDLDDDDDDKLSGDFDDSLDSTVSYSDYDSDSD